MIWPCFRILLRQLDFFIYLKGIFFFKWEFSFFVQYIALISFFVAAEDSGSSLKCKVERIVKALVSIFFYMKAFVEMLLNVCFYVNVCALCLLMWFQGCMRTDLFWSALQCSLISLFLSLSLFCLSLSLSICCPLSLSKTYTKNTKWKSKMFKPFFIKLWHLYLCNVVIFFSFWLWRMFEMFWPSQLMKDSMI